MKQLLISLLLLGSISTNAQSFSHVFKYRDITENKKTTYLIEESVATFNYRGKPQLRLQVGEKVFLFYYKSVPENVETYLGKAQRVVLQDPQGKYYYLYSYGNALYGISITNGITEISYHNIDYDILK